MVNNFLNKDINFSIWVIPIDKILGALANAIWYSMLISYLLYNIIILISPLEMQLSFLRLSSDFTRESSINILSDQILILSQFFNFLIDAVQLEFGMFNGTNRFIMVSNAFKNTLLFLFSGLLCSLIMSMILLFLRQFKIIKNTLIQFLCNISLLHIVIIFIFFDLYLINFTNSDFPFFWKILFCSLIVSLGSGMLVDYYNLIKEEFDNIMSKDYVQFAKDSGFNKYRFASKELIFNLISISISRIPLVFSGLVIIEYNMRDDGLEGISTFIFNRLDVGDDMSMFVAVFISIIFFSLIYFLSEKIKESLIQK